MAEQLAERVVLVGLRGSGKSAVASAAAEMLGWRAVDTDAAVERQLGPIAELFSAGQEASFRAEEARQVEAALSMSKVVVATGGGAVMSDDTRELLRAELCVWLWAPPEVLVERTHGSTRPPLTQLSPLAEVQQLLRQRYEAYVEVADVAVNTEHLAVAEVARLVVAVWSARFGEA